jgi:tetratricopeptide (TPR) repeat protein
MVREKSLELFELILNSIIACLILAFFYYIHYFQPVAYVYLISEDYWCEYATFSLFFVSSLILFLAITKYPEFRKPGHFAFALLSLFIAMEEISWGQRIFHFSTPDVIEPLSYQGEMSFHNIAESKQYVPYIGKTLILGGMVLPVLAKLFAWIRNFCSQWGIPIVSVRHWPYFALTVYLFDYYYEFLQISFNRELGEFSLALAVFVVARDLALKPEQKAYDDASILRSLKMMGIITIITVPLVVFFHDKHHIDYRLNQFGSTQYPAFGMYKQAALVFDYIDRHPKYLKKDTLYYHGLVLLKLGRNEEANDMLENALEKIKVLQLEEPNNPEVFRATGKIFHVLWSWTGSC